jgi:hypothetical protein
VEYGSDYLENLVISVIIRLVSKAVEPLDIHEVRNNLDLVTMLVARHTMSILPIGRTVLRF